MEGDGEWEGQVSEKPNSGKTKKFFLEIFQMIENMANKGDFWFIALSFICLYLFVEGGFMSTHYGILWDTHYGILLFLKFYIFELLLPCGIIFKNFTILAYLPGNLNATSL